MSDEIIISNNPIATEPSQPETGSALTSPTSETIGGQSEAVEDTQTTAPVENSPTPQVPLSTSELSDSTKVDTTPDTNSTENLSQERAPETPEDLKDTPVIESSNTPVATENTLIPAPEPSKIIVLTRSAALKLLAKAREAIQFRRRKKLDRLMTLFLKKPQITNDDVEKLLHVSDNTATRYLSILEKEGKIRRNEKTGRGVTYSRI